MRYTKEANNQLSQEIKVRVTIPMVWEWLYGSKPERLNSLHCPWRPDKNPSFGISQDGQVWIDRGTGDRGDVFNFYQKATGCDARQAWLYVLGKGGGKVVERGDVLLSSRAAAQPKRQYHPKLRQPTAGDLTAISTLRSICIEGLQLAVDRGFLWITEISGFSAFLVTDKSRKCYVVRRLDGGKWEWIDKYPLILTGGTVKWPIGILEAKDYSAIALCEGQPDFLSAFGHAWASGVESQVAPVCIPTGSVLIAEDALSHFTGKRVRIFGHNDPAGQETLKRWKAQLTGVATKIDSFDFSGLIQTGGQPVKDLNDLARIDADCWEANRNRIWTVMDI